MTDFHISGAVLVFQGLHQVMGLITPNSFEITVVARLAKLKYFLCHQCSPFLVVASLCLASPRWLFLVFLFVLLGQLWEIIYVRFYELKFYLLAITGNIACHSIFSITEAETVKHGPPLGVKKRPYSNKQAEQHVEEHLLWEGGAEGFPLTSATV